MTRGPEHSPPAPPRGPWRNIADGGLIVVFLVLIGLPAAGNVRRPAEAAVTENRSLAPAPEWKPTRKFPGQFEAFFNDHFGFRQALIRGLAFAEVRWLRVSASAKVILGKHGWLFYTDQPVGTRHRARRPLAAGQLECWRQLLEARRDWLAARGIRYVFVIAPDKQTIYPENLPRALRGEQVHDSRLDQLLGYLRAHSDVVAPDLRTPLLRAKERERVYYETDSHWNECGAFVAYQRIVDALSPWFAGVRPLPRGAFADVAVSGIAGDCASLLSLSDRFNEDGCALRRQTPCADRQLPGLPPFVSPTEPRIVVEQADSTLPRALVLRDSFGAALVPFLAEHFRRTVFAWEDYPVFDVGLIERERPDVVIQEMVERKLSYPDVRGRVRLALAEAGQTEAALGRTPREWLAWLQRGDRGE